MSLHGVSLNPHPYTPIVHSMVFTDTFDKSTALVCNTSVLPKRALMAGVPSKGLILVAYPHRVACLETASQRYGRGQKSPEACAEEGHTLSEPPSCKNVLRSTRHDVR